MSHLVRMFLFLATAAGASAAAVDWRLLGDWSGSEQFAGFVITFAPDGGYVIAQEGVPAGFGNYAVDGRQILLFPGGAGEFPERGAYGFSGPDRLFVMTQNFGRSEWQRIAAFQSDGANRSFEYGEPDAEAKSSFEKAVEQLEKLSASLEDVERKLDGDAAAAGEQAEAEAGGRKRSLFDRMKDAARKTAGTAGNLGRKAARSVKAAGEAWRGADDEEKKTEGDGDRESAESAEATAPAGINPLLGGAAPMSGANARPTDWSGGIGGPVPSAPATPVFGALPGPVIVDPALVQRATLLAAKWQPDAGLVEIVAQLGPDGSANVAASPQAVELWFVSAQAPGDGLKLSLTPDGSFVTAPAARTVSGGAIAPAEFIASPRAVNSAQQAGLRGDRFNAALRAVPGADGSWRFGWILAPANGASGGGEIVIDAVTGQPLR